MGSDLPSAAQPTLLNRARERLMRAIKRRSSPANKNELAKVIEQASQDEIINEATEDMIRGVFEITNRRIGDIMIPRSQIIAIDSECTIAEAIAIVSEYGHSRYPVTFEDKDHVLGIVMAKDLLPLANKLEQKISDCKEILRKPVVVPESKRVDTMLKDFQKNRFHMAMVIDEYGGICGLVTIEDILELIVGEINDEYETEVNSSNIIKNSGSDNSYTINGATPIEEFEEYFKTKLPDIDVDTVAGLVVHSCGHIPHQDETTTINEFTFKVLAIESHQVQSLLLTITKTEEE